MVREKFVRKHYSQEEAREFFDKLHAKHHANEDTKITRLRILYMFCSAMPGFQEKTCEEKREIFNKLIKEQEEQKN